MQKGKKEWDINNSSGWGQRRGRGKRGGGGGGYTVVVVLDVRAPEYYTLIGTRNYVNMMWGCRYLLTDVVRLYSLAAVFRLHQGHP